MGKKIITIDKMLHYAPFHLGLHTLPKNLFLDSGLQTVNFYTLNAFNLTLCMLGFKNLLLPTFFQIKVFKNII